MESKEGQEVQPAKQPEKPAGKTIKEKLVEKLKEVVNPENAIKITQGSTQKWN